MIRIHARRQNRPITRVEAPRDDREIVVFAMRTGHITDAQADSLSMVLSEEERARAGRFVRRADRITYVATHALTRIQLARYIGDRAAPEALRFATGELGKPMLAQADAPVFNLSHCQGLAACAIAAAGALGVDAERPPAQVPEEVVERCFTDQEKHWLKTLDPLERARGFASIWTLKEAYIKATGKGLSQPLDELSFQLDAPRISFHAPPGDPANWRFARYDLQSGHVVSLAWSDR